MNAPLFKRRSKSEASPAETSAGWRDLDWDRLTHSDAVVRALVSATQTAGSLALDFFRPGEKTSAAVTKKLGGSPVTEADHAVNRYLEQKLRNILPDAAWLSEESTDSLERLGQDLVLIVDPIDGTRSFAVGERGWAVSVAVVHRHRPVVGIVFAPALNEFYIAVKNSGARLNGRKIRVSERKGLDAGARVGGPLSLAQELRAAGLEFDLLPKISSLSVRISKVAVGALDAALISANAHDWDIAASDLIVDEAGGRLASLFGGQILYNLSGTRHGELAAASVPILAQINAAATQARAS